MLPEILWIQLEARSRDEVGTQPGTGAHVGFQHRHGRGQRHGGVSSEGLFDVVELDPHATHLHLVVAAVECLVRAVGQPADDVAGSVGPQPVGSAGEALFRQVRPPEIPVREAVADEDELTDAVRHAASVVEQQRSATRDGATDRYPVARGRIGVGHLVL